jgi:opacity protein-like surface antigen
MKKAILSVIILMACGLNANAQVFKLGIKAGPNFANFTGSDINTSTRTGFHGGAAAELGITSKFAIAPEFLYSSQGADFDGFGDVNFDYVAVPVLARIYILSDKLSIDVGPQFSFLVDNSDEAFDNDGNQDFDFAVAGGLTLNLTKSIFLQARYTAGLTEASKDAEVKNSVFQVSVGYYFF